MFRKSDFLDCDFLYCACNYWSVYIINDLMMDRQGADKKITVGCYQADGKSFAVVEGETIEANTMLERTEKVKEILEEKYGPLVTIIMRVIPVP